MKAADQFAIYDARRPAIVVLDDFFMDPDQVRCAALVAKKTNSNRHKGARSESYEIPANIGEAIATNLRIKGVTGYCCYQLCLAGDPLVFHSDSQRWAAAAYLTPHAPYDGGTSFFASRAKNEVRSSAHVQDVATERLVYGNRLLDRTAWHEVDRVGNVYNRLVIWDARLIHSATEYFGSHEEDGRLFMMIFFDEAS